MEMEDKLSETLEGDHDDEETDRNEEEAEPGVQTPTPPQHHKHMSTETLFENEKISQIATAYSWPEFQRFVNGRTGCLPQQKGILFNTDEIQSTNVIINWYTRNEESIFPAAKSRLWRDDSELEGMPYIYCGKNAYFAQGSDGKFTNEEINMLAEESYVVRKIIVFPGFKLFEDRWKKKEVERLESLIRKQLEQNDKQLDKKVVFLINLSKMDRSLEKPVNPSKAVNLHVRVLFKIEQLTLQGCTNTEIQQSIDDFVANELFINKTPPSKTNERYYPPFPKIKAVRDNALYINTLTADDIRNLVKFFNTLKLNDESDIVFKVYQSQPRKAKVKELDTEKVSTSDEELDLLRQLKLGESYSRRNFIKPSQWDFPIQQYSLLHQSEPQQYLLNKYGSTIQMVEIKAEDYGFDIIGVSLFIMSVRTNVDYQVVGTILCNRYNDHTKVLKEALTEFKEINEFWKPKYLMIDPSESIVAAVKDVFPGSEFFFNKESCIREWQTYLTDPSNGLKDHSDKILRHLKALQMAESIDEVDRLMDNIPPEEDWLKSVEFSGDGFWISQYEKWMKCCLPKDLIFFLRDDWLRSAVHFYRNILESYSKKDTKGLMMLMAKLTDEKPKSRYSDSYVLKNEMLFKDAMSAATRYSSFEKNFGLPLFMMSHCASIMDNSQTTKSNNTGHTVTLGNQRTFPSCNCENWKFNRMPCAHFLRIFKETNARYSSLSPLYRASPCFQIDLSCVRNKSKSLSKGNILPSEIVSSNSTAEIFALKDSPIDFQNESKQLDENEVREDVHFSSNEKSSAHHQVPQIQSKREDETILSQKTQLKMLPNTASKLPSLTPIIGARVSPMTPIFGGRVLPVTNISDKNKASQQIEKLNSIPSENEKIRAWLQEQKLRKEDDSSKTSRTSNHLQNKNFKNVPTVSQPENPSKRKTNREIIGEKRKLLSKTKFHVSTNIAATTKKSKRLSQKMKHKKTSLQTEKQTSNTTEQEGTCSNATKLQPKTYQYASYVEPSKQSASSSVSSIQSEGLIPDVEIKVESQSIRFP